MRRLTSIAFFLALLAILKFAQASDLRFHFIAVGHGDAILLEAEGQGLALVDAGPPDSSNAVLHYLESQGIESIEHLFITHVHDDHTGGIPSVLDSLQVGTIHITGMLEDQDTQTHLNSYLESGKWPVDTVNSGDLPINAAGLKIEVLSPRSAETAGKAISPNAYSMVLLVSHGEVQLLLAADIDRDREKWLIKQYGQKLRCQALKASHHASPFGNCAEFLQVVQPHIVVVTVGPSKWGYPSEETVQRLKMNCPIVLRTDEVGTVVLQSDGKQIKVLSQEIEKP